MGKIRGTHSSPGPYTSITDLSYAAKNFGITSLGLVGETLRGPAFDPIDVASWDEYVSYFGGTSAEKFKDSQYPKYELPYIAQSYLKVSDRLKVCRVLGLSGYNAGPAFIITASNGETGDTAEEYVIAVLRSRGKYVKHSTADKDEKGCPIMKYDNLVYDCDDFAIVPYEGTLFTYDCNGVATASTSADTVELNPLNKGRFTIICYKEGEEIGKYSVSLIPGAKDYIYRVLGSDPNEGNAAVFVEELYDVMLDTLIENGTVTEIVTHDTGSTKYIEDYVINKAVCEPVVDFLTIPTEELEKRHVGLTYVYSAEYQGEAISGTPKYSEVVNGVYDESGVIKEGDIVEVVSFVTKTGERKYGYQNKATLSGTTDEANEKLVVKVRAYNAFVTLKDGEVSFMSDFSDYREQFRYASTPWIVSELKGDMSHAEVKKLFRFHTITDGNYANRQIKISIANIRPDDGLFDVQIRDFNDTDANPVILESYKNLDMVPGSNKYIGLKIGTINGDYELKSKYVMVEVIENDMTETCVPAGFLGYPVRTYGNFHAPEFTYNTFYDDEIKPKRQYFGLSDITGVDVDMFTYKGKNAYTDKFYQGYTNAFHLDSHVNHVEEIVVDGDPTTKGIAWTGVDVSNIVGSNASGKEPVIGSDSEMEGTIYEDVRVRKFTVYPYGGFDGWDIYRKSRTNTNEYKANKYKGTISNGEGSSFSTISDGMGLGLTGNCITSDYYAYLAGIKQFENAEQYEINLFATPGIDYVNNEYLVSDAIDMVEGRLDTFYVVTTPDKPWGASDGIDEMYTSKEAADNLSDTSVDTYYGTTYYPWVKFFDKNNNMYINLPATKDAVRNMAGTDNKRYPWIAPAGVERGTVECKKMHFPAKLEDRDTVYDNRINSLISVKEGVKIWGNKTLYVCDETDPMNRINSVRLVLYMRKLILEATRVLFFEPNDETLKEDFEGLVKPILSQIKADRGVTDYRLVTSQTKEQMDAHEMSGKLWVKPTPTFEYLELEFVVTPQGVEFA